MSEGQTLEVKEDDADAKYVVAIGKAIVVKKGETTVVTPPENEVIIPAETEAVIPPETATAPAGKNKKKGS